MSGISIVYRVEGPQIYSYTNESAMVQLLWTEACDWEIRVRFLAPEVISDLVHRPLCVCIPHTQSKDSLCLFAKIIE